MMGEVFYKYRKNFKNFLVFFLMSAILTLITFKLVIPDMDSIIEGSEAIKSFIFSNVLILLVIFVAEVFVSIYGLILAKKAITFDSENPIDYKEDFSSSLSLYPKYLLLSIITGVALAVIFGIFLLVFLGMIKGNSYSLITLLFIVVLIVVTIFTILVLPMPSYLVYYKKGIWNSIKGGMKIGKSYFFKLLGILIIGMPIAGLAQMEIVESNIILVLIFTLITSMYQMYLHVYIMNLVYKEI